MSDKKEFKGLVKNNYIDRAYFKEGGCFVGNDKKNRPEFDLIVENVVIMSKKRYFELTGIKVD